MLDISEMTLREIALPLREPFQIASGLVEDRRILLVEIKNEHGTSGWAECVAMEGPGYSPETIDTAWIMIRDWVAPRVMGREFNKPEEVHPLLERNFRGHEMAKAAVEMAVWELSAQNRWGCRCPRYSGGNGRRFLRVSPSAFKTVPKRWQRRPWPPPKKATSGSN